MPVRFYYYFNLNLIHGECKNRSKKVGPPAALYWLFGIKTEDIFYLVSFSEKGNF